MAPMRARRSMGLRWATATRPRIPADLTEAGTMSNRRREVDTAVFHGSPSTLSVSTLRPPLLIAHFPGPGLVMNV